MLAIERRRAAEEAKHQQDRRPHGQRLRPHPSTDKKQHSN
jgi:hypothetical protein